MWVGLGAVGGAHNYGHGSILLWVWLGFVSGALLYIALGGGQYNCGWVLVLWEELIIMGMAQYCCGCGLALSVELYCILLWVEVNIIVGGSWRCGKDSNCGCGSILFWV